MGTPEDMMIRREQCRKDDQERRKKIDDARVIIHRHHYNVNTDEVERLLKPTSLVPTVVSRRRWLPGLSMIQNTNLCPPLLL